jgi:hypothetical protein
VKIRLIVESSQGRLVRLETAVAAHQRNLIGKKPPKEGPMF